MSVSLFPPQEPMATLIDEVPTCPICGTPFRENRFDPAFFGLKKINRRLRYAPACACLELEHRREEAERRRREEEEARKAEIERLFAESRLTPRFADRTFNNFVPKDLASEAALAVVSDYARNFELSKEPEVNGIYLYGGYDRGKTHLAAAVANLLIPQRFSVIYLKMIRLVSLLREAKHSEESVEDAKFPLYTCDLLILDDIGAETRREWVTGDLFEILDLRYEARLPVFITSNLTLSEAGEFYNQRVASRIQRMCYLQKI